VRTTKAMAAVLVAVLMIGALGVTVPVGAGSSSYEDPFFLNWPTLLASSPVEDYELSSSTECKNGQVQCVDNAIRQMTKRYNALGCDHDSTFAFTYLLTTEEYRW
jgi:hypothetical protein